MKKALIFLQLLLFFPIIILLGCKKNNGGDIIPPPPENPVDTSKPVFKTLNYLYSISGTKTVAGQEGSAYVDSMYNITGKYPGLWGEDFSFAPFFGKPDLASSRDSLAVQAKNRWQTGQIIALMFHACPPTMGEPCDFSTNVQSTLTDAQWTELITDGTPLNNAWKARLDAVIPALQYLKENGVEVLWRPLHEMNQSAFWWGGRPGSNGTAKLYQITHDYLVKTKGITNLIWVWNLQDFASLGSDLVSYDPGSSYWDVLALDVYWSDGTGLTTTKYNEVLTKAAGKPIAVGECDVLYTSADYAAQPKWTYFMGWRELTQQKNSNDRIYSIYNAGNIITLDEMPGWK